MLRYRCRQLEKQHDTLICKNSHLFLIHNKCNIRLFGYLDNRVAITNHLKFHKMKTILKNSITNQVFFYDRLYFFFTY